MLGSGGPGTEEETSKRMKRLLYIMDAMTTEELDSDGKMFQDVPKDKSGKGKKTVVATKGSDKSAGKAKESSGSGPGKSSTPAQGSELAEGQPRRANRRVLRVARGSGTSVREVEELLAQHQMFQGMFKKMGSKNKNLFGGGAGGLGGAQSRLGGRGMPSQAQIQAAQQRMSSMGLGNMDMQAMMRSLGGGGGPGGLDMSKLSAMANQMGLGGMLGQGR